jgi:hypothetical protein
MNIPPQIFQYRDLNPDIQVVVFWLPFETCLHKPLSKIVTTLLHFLKMLEIRFVPERCNIQGSSASANRRWETQWRQDGRTTVEVVTCVRGGERNFFSRGLAPSLNVVWVPVKQFVVLWYPWTMVSVSQCEWSCFVRLAVTRFTAVAVINKISDIWRTSHLLYRYKLSVQRVYMWLGYRRVNCCRLGYVLHTTHSFKSWILTVHTR